MLKVGRHIRPNPDFKLIIGRDEGENYFFESYQHQYTSIKPISHLGPLSLIDGKINPEYIHYAAKIVARFTDAKSNDNVTFEISPLNGSVQTVKVFPFTADQIPKEWYISG